MIVSVVLWVTLTWLCVSMLLVTVMSVVVRALRNGEPRSDEPVHAQGGPVNHLRVAGPTPRSSG